MTTWACPRCQRRFTRRNQRHACGISDGTDVLRNRAPALVETYLALEKLLKTFGNVELVMRDRYVLFRSARIFADVVIMSDAVRLAIHLPRQVAHELFVKVVRDRRQVTHVAKLYEAEQVPALKDFLREAYEFSLS